MTLAVGARLGPYEIIAPLGAGGMGEVYRAADTRLGRDVALKVLPDAFATDADRLARFQREAKALAALNHPNIGGIHGLEESNGVTALILELVDGPTLADIFAGSEDPALPDSGRGRPSGRPLPIDEALQVAKQIAEALEAAHEQGIVHRDLKPANIKLRPDGTVKVLDFGLAKAMEPQPARGAALSPSLSPTLMQATELGVILGTAAYMSPEQARGKPVDRRADIWAFGCVLFEMLTGRRPFDGEDVAETLGAIIHKEPAWNALPSSTPTVVRRVLQRCLVKEPKQRLRDVGDARLDIESVLLAPAAVDTTAGPSGPASRSRIAMAGWLVAVPLGLLAGGVGFVHFTERASDPAPAVRFEIAAPDKTTLVTGGVISPDGRVVAFVVRDERGLMTIWVRPLDSPESRRLEGTEASNIGLDLFWSPDSRFIGYSANQTLQKIAVSGGPPQKLANLEGSAYRGGAWSRDDVVVFGLQGKGLRRVPAEGGTASVLTTVDLTRESSHVGPMFLPDGRRFLYTRVANQRQESEVYVGTLDPPGTSPNPQRLVLATSSAVFASSSTSSLGHLVFVRGRTLLAQPFDAARVQVAGEAVPLVENMSELGERAFSASTTGVLTFRRAGGAAGSRLIWFDRQGNSLGEVGPPAPYGDVVLAPDGKTLFVSQRESQTDTTHLWIVDLKRMVRSRLNPDALRDYAPAVSPDGRIVFSSGFSGDLYIRPASGAGEPELLLRSANIKHPNDWSADGRFIVYDEQHPSRRQDLWMLPLAGDRKPIPFLTTVAHEVLAQFSPDDRWVAYSSDESGRREVYVRDFAPDRVPAVGSARITMSNGGGSQPRWRSDGSELYYIAPGGTMMAVPVKLGPAFEPGVPVPLFNTNVAGTFSYDVTAEGRFLVNTISEQDSSSPPITVVMNWQAALKK